MNVIDKNSVCIIPAKGYSERLPGKNIKLLGGKPLLAYTIQCALASGLFDDVVVSTEDESVARIAERYGAEVPYRRPANLAANDRGVADVCIDLLRFLRDHRHRRYKTTSILLPTSPFRQPQHLREAMGLFHARPGTPVLMSVTQLDYQPFWAMKEEKDGRLGQLFPPELAGRRRHDLPKTYKWDGVIMILDTKEFMTNGSYLFPEIVPYHTPQDAALDIDTPTDFAFAEYLLDSNRSNAREVA